MPNQTKQRVFTEVEIANALSTHHRLRQRVFRDLYENGSAGTAIFNAFWQQMKIDLQELLDNMHLLGLMGVRYEDAQFDRNGLFAGMKS